MRDKHRGQNHADEGECPGADGRKEQVYPMSLGTKTFLVAALMAIVALSGSLGASNARAQSVPFEPGHIAH